MGSNESPAHADQMEALANFAGNYLLGDQQDGQNNMCSPNGLFGIPEHPQQNTSSAEQFPSLNPADRKSQSSGLRNAQADRRDGEAMNKSQADPDSHSSEWDQTQERCGSQQGLNLMGNTDSPESVQFNRAAAAAAAGSMHNDGPMQSRPMLDASEAGHTESYGHRGKSDNGGPATDAEHMQMSHPQQMGRFGLEGGAALPSRESGPHSEDKGWERRGGMAGGPLPAAGYGSQGYGAYPGHGGPGMDTPFRRTEGRDAWSSGMADMQGSLDSSAWGMRVANARGPLNGLSRMHSDMSGMPLRERVPASRHSYGEEAYDAPPRGNMELNAHMEAMYGDPGMQGMASAQGDGRRGHRRSISNGVGLPHQTPPRRLAPQDFHSPQQPSTPSETTRKRRRGDGYPMLEPSMGQDLPGFEGMDRMATRVPKQQQEQLIYNLKQQIEGLDQQTQGLLKDTLYRISRNANAANGVVEPSFRTNQRNAFLDKVVANFMYNRFSPSVVTRPTGIPPGSRFGTPTFLGRASSSPAPYETSKQSLHMEP